MRSRHSCSENRADDQSGKGSHEDDAGEFSPCANALELLVELVLTTLKLIEHPLLLVVNRLEHLEEVLVERSVCVFEPLQLLKCLLVSVPICEPEKDEC